MKKSEIIIVLTAAVVIMMTFAINSYHREIRGWFQPKIVTASEEQPELKQQDDNIFKPLTTWAGKKSYYRFELVDLFASVKDLDKKTIPNARVTAKFYYKNKLIRTITDMVEIELKFNPASGLYEGKWPIPWNPPLGEYEALIIARTDDPSPILKEQIPFRIAGREPPLMPDGFQVMAVEYQGDFENRAVEGPDGKIGNWKNFASWAKFMGADAVFCMGGMTDGNVRKNANGEIILFKPETLRNAKKLGAEVKKNGMKSGAWIMSYMMQVKNFEPFGYAGSVGYEPSTGALTKSYHISLADRKRLNDLVDIVKDLDKNPNIDFIGIDYIRTGLNGFEMVNDVVADMSIPVPANWKQMGERDRIVWFARKIDVEKDDDAIEKWRWWRAHKSAMNVAEIIERSGTQKPVWIFSLGWEHGKQHGQDPLMFNDAGVTYDAVMLYEANQMQFRAVLSDWKHYLRSKQVNIICGNSVDVTLLDSNNCTPPEEIVRRTILGSKQLLFGGMTDGIFWHDLSRALWGNRKGEFSTKEWALTGAVCFSRYRQEKGISPISIKIDCPEYSPIGAPFKTKIKIENTSLDPLQNVTVEIESVEGLKDIKNKAVKIEHLNPGEEVSCEFDLSLVSVPDKTRWNIMLPVKVSYGGEKSDFDFQIVKCRRSGPKPAPATNNNDSIAQEKS